MLKKQTWLAIALIVVTNNAFSMAQPINGPKTLVQTLDALPYACALANNYRLSEQSIQRLQSFYQTVNYMPVWQDVAQRQQLTGLLQDLRFDGLEPAQYQLQHIAALAQPAAYEQHICDELLVSHGYLQALQHLSDGVLDPNVVEPYWYEAAVQQPTQSSIVQTAVAGLQNLSQVFELLRPQSSTYQALREILKNSDVLRQTDWGAVPTEGRSLRVGMLDVRVPRLQERLQMEGYSTAKVAQPAESINLERLALDGPIRIDPLLYTEELARAVKVFQQDHYLESDGVVGPATLRELNISPEQRLQQVRVNLERLRWLDKHFESTMLIVDIAGARLLFFRDGNIVWRTRTQVGTVRRQTPLLKSRITHLTINPTWTVPPTILREDKLPAIRRDQSYLTRNNMSVLDYQGNVLNPSSINWNAPSGIMLRQGPGPSNALGLVAIRFANPFTVYLHDTPSQYLFGRATRTVSSGCVRVEDAQKLVEHLLFDASPAERERIEAIQASGKTRNVDLPKPVPVLLAYWTVEVDIDNRLRFRSDSYGYDARVANALQAAQR